MKKPQYNVGGEAVIEGVMMRSPHYYAIAVRRADKKISVTSGTVNSVSEKHKFWKWPLMRGILSMWESMSMGMSSLTWSADLMEKDMEAAENKKNGVKKGAKAKAKDNGMEMIISIALAIVMALVLFFLIPFGINKLIGKVLPEINTNRFYFNLGMVVFKFLMFFLYVWAISKLEDVKRLFQYHGAEHKCIYAFEDGKKLTYANIKPYSTRHPRCGTAFIIITVAISLVIFFIFLPAELNIFQRLLFEIPLLLPIIGISYEILKLSHKFRDNFFMKILIAPGLAFQRLTTKEPDKDMVEVSVKSLNTVVALENKYIKLHSKKTKKAKK